VRRKAHRGGQCVVQRGGVDDPGQRLGALLPGGEFDLRARRVTGHDHVVDRGHRIGGQCVPHLQRRQQVARPGVERVGAYIGRRRRKARRRRQQLHGQALARQAQGQRHADRTGTTDAHIGRVHGSNCRKPGGVASAEKRAE